MRVLIMLLLLSTPALGAPRFHNDTDGDPVQVAPFRSAPVAPLVPLWRFTYRPTRSTYYPYLHYRSAPRTDRYNRYKPGPYARH
jgi:hypothetical protein